jgi:hypothetical protein
MSLINDALKRAHQAQKNQPPRAPGPPLQSADNIRRSSFSLFGLLLVCGGVGLAAWFYFKQPEPAATAPLAASSKQGLNEPAESVHASFVQALPELPSGLPLQPSPLPVHPPPAAMDPVPPAEIPVSVAPVPPEVASSAPPEMSFPELKLQGIFFRLKNPSVLINGKTVTDGDNLDGVTVLKIERQSVLVEWNGETKVLRMDSF